MTGKFNAQHIELYKCAMLTLIAILLLGLLLKTPFPVNRKNYLQHRKDIPYVHVSSGSVTVDGTVAIEE